MTAPPAVSQTSPAANPITIALLTGVTSEFEFGQHKGANCRRWNEILSNVFITLCRMRKELPAHNAEQAFVIWIEDTGP
jgi:hypothetical protein